jgi:NAD(P)-dependent dehydrogenase (short-subunit alcohol dehydrogenase family)
MPRQRTDRSAGYKSRRNVDVSLTTAREPEITMRSMKTKSRALEQIGALAVFLCSDSAAQIRGAALPIDGGWTAQ